MKIALIAHDKKKELLIEFCRKNKHVLEKHTLFATGTTGTRIMENTSLEITRVKSGPLGGDQQIGSLVCQREMDLIVFFRDPLTAQPHEPDVNALLRLCDVYSVPLATNLTSANLIISVLDSNNLEDLGHYQHLEI